VSAAAGELLTVAEVAAACRVSADVVYGWIDAGELPAEDLGAGGKRATYRVDPADLDEFRRRRRTTRPAKPAPRRRLTVEDVTRYF